MAGDWSPFLTVGILASACVLLTGVVGVAVGRRSDRVAVSALLCLAGASLCLACVACVWSSAEPAVAARGLAFAVILVVLVAAEALVVVPLVSRLGRRTVRRSAPRVDAS
jgi:NADH:ubiquinone oxidoreductase subunit K